MSSDLGRVTSRRSLPVVISIIMVTTGALIYALQKQVISVEMAVFLQACIHLVILLTVMWANARYVNCLIQTHYLLKQVLYQLLSAYLVYANINFVHQNINHECLRLKKEKLNNTNFQNFSFPDSKLCHIGAWFRELANNIHEVFHIVSADLTETLYISPSYQEVWGRSCEGLYQNTKSWLESIYIEDQERLVKACDRLIHGLPLLEEYRIVRPNGDIRWIFTRLFPIYNQKGEIIRHVGISEDLTDQKQAEIEIRELNEKLEQGVQQRTAELITANQELESFSYSVSHDLRSPLRSIDGFSKALLERYQEQLDEKGRHYLQRIRASTKRMGELIDDLLLLSQVTRSQIRRTQVNLSAIAQEIVQELSENYPERRINWQIAPNLIVEGDRRLLRIVVENLLNNAWKFTTGQVNSQIEFNCLTLDSPEGSYLAYFVHDNGVGFDEAYASRLFQPFQRLHTTDEFPGTGIGLATVQRIIHRHGGHVWANAIVNKGAIFYFTL
jgi:PAS domain S-box-containing protein